MNSPSAPGRCSPNLARRAVALGLLGTPLAIALSVHAAPPQMIVITTTKPLGPAAGSFSAIGAFADTGIMTTLSRVVSALPAPFGVVTHLQLRFDGQYGTFTLRTQIAETVTRDPVIFANQGNWAIVSGTAYYSALAGSGSIEGTVDDAANLITRVFTGRVTLK